MPKLPPYLRTGAVIESPDGKSVITSISVAWWGWPILFFLAIVRRPVRISVPRTDWMITVLEDIQLALASPPPPDKSQSARAFEIAQDALLHLRSIADAERE